MHIRSAAVRPNRYVFPGLSQSRRPARVSGAAVREPMHGSCLETFRRSPGATCRVRCGREWSGAQSRLRARVVDACSRDRLPSYRRRLAPCPPGILSPIPTYIYMNLTSTWKKLYICSSQPGHGTYRHDPDRRPPRQSPGTTPSCRRGVLRGARRGSRRTLPRPNRSQRGSIRVAESARMRVSLLDDWSEPSFRTRPGCLYGRACRLWPGRRAHCDSQSCSIFRATNGYNRHGQYTCIQRNSGRRPACRIVPAALWAQPASGYKWQWQGAKDASSNPVNSHCVCVVVAPSSPRMKYAAVAQYIVLFDRLRRRRASS